MIINKKFKIIIGAVIILLVLVILLLLWLLFFNKQIEEDLRPSDQSTLQIPDSSLPAAQPLPESLAEEQNGFAVLTELRAVSSTFAERFGSYSNESNFYNLESSLDLMSDKMRQWAQEYKDSAPKADRFSSYYGISTKAVSISVDDFDETLAVATVTVSTQRSEFQDSDINPQVFYQNLVLTLVQESGRWKVDSASWVEIE